MFVIAAVIGACGVAAAWSGRDAAQPAILGTAPNYGPGAVTSVPNLAAAGPLLWMPGLDDGWTPQGLAFAAGNLLISAYRSERFAVNRGPCRVFRVNPASGRETGHFDVPAPCGHAGGLGYGGNGKLYIADTRALFEVDLARAFLEPAPPFRTFVLGPGLKGALAASGPEAIWLGTYEENMPGEIFKFDLGVLEGLPDRAMLDRERASIKLPIPSYAQGAAVSSGNLWISRSEIGWGSLERLDMAGGRTQERYPVAGGIEGIAIDDGGRLWAVSEAGARHFLWRWPFFPLVFRLDVARMKADGSGSDGE